MSRPGAPALLESVEGFVILCQATCVTLSEEWATQHRVPISRGGTGEPTSLECLGCWILAWALAWAGAKSGIRLGLPSVGSSGF
jgi:hypothetical protein